MRLKRGMRFNPIMKLIVNDADVPRLRRETEKLREQTVVRRIYLKDAIADVIGEGQYTYVWFGKNENSTCLLKLNQKEMREIVQKYQEAMSALT